MSASMFAGANNVKIFGGDFKTINGSYHQHNHTTNHNNHNSNNILGNDYQDIYNDHSQTIYGSKGGARHQVPRRHPAARRAETADEPAHHHETLASPPPANEQPPAPLSRSQTIPSTAMNLSPFNFGQGMTFPGSLVQSFQNGNSFHNTYMDAKPGDVQAMDPQSAFLFQMFMSSVNRHHQDDDDEVEEGGEDINMAIHGVEPSFGQGQPRSQSPPIDRMAQLSLGDPSLHSGPHPQPSTRTGTHYTPQMAGSVLEKLPPLPQGQAQTHAEYAPETPASIFVQTPPPASFPRQQQFHPQPAPGLSNLSPFLKSSFHAVEHAANLQASNQGHSFVNVPHSSSRTLFDTTNPTSPSVISTQNADRSTSTAAAEAAKGLAPEDLKHVIFNGAFTELSHVENRNNYGLSGMIANNSIQHLYNRFDREDDVDVDEDEEEMVGAAGKKRKSAGNQGRVPPSKRRS